MSWDDEPEYEGEDMDEDDDDDDGGGGGGDLNPFRPSLGLLPSFDAVTIQTSGNRVGIAGSLAAELTKTAQAATPMTAGGILNLINVDPSTISIPAAPTPSQRTSLSIFEFLDDGDDDKTRARVLLQVIQSEENTNPNNIIQLYLSLAFPHMDLSNRTNLIKLISVISTLSDLESKYIPTQRFVINHLQTMIETVLPPQSLDLGRVEPETPQVIHRPTQNQSHNTRSIGFDFGSH